MKNHLKSVISTWAIICGCFCFSACGTVNEEQVLKESETIISGEVVSEPESKEEDSHKSRDVEINTYYILQHETVESDFSKYGKMETIHNEYQTADGMDTYYYDMECFYFDESYPTVLNETLRAYYDSVEEGYIPDSQVYEEPFEGSANTPYNSLIFQYITYVGEDYVSMVYNNVCYMGGAHPYTAMDGITMDCKTGEIVDVQRFLDESPEQIGEQLQAVLGMDSASMEEWDYYLTENNVVFFYFDPRYWESVAVRRVR